MQESILRDSETNFQFHGLTVAEADELEHMKLQIEKKIVARVEMCELFEVARCLKERAYVEACKYCVVPYKAEEVPAGEQIR